jgi:hypothetical protein
MSHHFGNVLVDNTSEPQTFTIYNVGMANLTVSTINWIGNSQDDFSLTAIGLPWAITPGDSMMFTVLFNPTSRGDKVETIRVAHDATSSPTNITVFGTCDPPPPIVNLSLTEFDFGNVLTEEHSTVQEFTITNTGGATLIIQPISISGFNANDFRFHSVNSTAVAINSGDDFVFSVLFSPRTDGDKAANVLIAHNAIDSPAIVSLTGTGIIPIIEVTPPSHNFGEVAPFYTSPTQIFVITNEGGADLTVFEITMTGFNREEFNLEDLPFLPFTIAKDDFRSFSVSFSPLSSGPKHAIVNIEHNAAGSQTTVMVEGEGGVSEDDKVEIRMMTALLENFPNPFNPETTINFVIAGKALPVNIEIYNVNGQIVRTLLDGNRVFGTGRHSVVWNGLDNNGNQVGSGGVFL